VEQLKREAIFSNLGITFVSGIDNEKEIFDNLPRIQKAILEMGDEWLKKLESQEIICGYRMEKTSDKKFFLDIRKSDEEIKDFIKKNFGEKENLS